MPRLLVIDDEPNVRYSLQKGLASPELDVLTASSGQEGISRVQQQRPDAVILDVRLGDMSGLDAFDRIRQIDARLPVIIITAYTTTETAIEATKRGAFEYLLKPVDLHQLRETVERAIDVHRQRVVPALYEEVDESDRREIDRIIGRSPAMQEVYKAIGRVAPLDVPVLIVGESGTGKELVARAIYHHSHRADQPFLAINCAAIPEALLESELFGHERGAFTGADHRRIGKFEQANHGTILLDEIGDMTAAAQPKLLRLLQEQRFERLGGNETIETDVRIIAATNRNPEDLVQSGRLRQDLFFRLNVVTINLPPLRDRLDDIPLLVEHFLKRLNPKLNQRILSVAPETYQRLRAYSWPGNIRELQSVLKYALIHAQGDLLTPDCLPDSFQSSGSAVRPSASDASTLDVGQLVAHLVQSGEPEIYRKVSAAVDRIVLEAVLRHVHGNQIKASELLGISRTTLRAKLRSLDLDTDG